MSHGPGNRDEQALEAFAREWLDIVGGRLALGVTFSVHTTQRGPLRVTMTPPRAGGVSERRWIQVGSAIHTLLEVAITRRGLPEATVEVEVKASDTPAEQREEEGLASAVRDAAQTAVQLGRSFAIGPMSVNDRRLVHHILGEVPEVWTQSEGDGIYRRMWIVPRALMPGRGAPEKKDDTATPPSAVADEPSQG